MSRSAVARGSNSPSIPSLTNTSPLLQHPSRTARASRSGERHITGAHDSSPSTAHAAQSPSGSFHQSINEPSMPESTASPTESIQSPTSQPDQAGRRRVPSPSSSSQGDMPDTDAESAPSSQPEQSSSHQTSDQPVKKKRTRTLTTPHQSAVLHALLAQSRFPTTAMREEVGRQIGLSARKVQIWFQNQRQKARRPHGQNTAPHSLQRPPQFGPFPSVPMSAPPSDGAQGPWTSWQPPLPSTSATSPGHHETPPPGLSTQGLLFGGIALSDPQYPYQTLPPIEGQSSVFQSTSGMHPLSPGRRVLPYIAPGFSSRVDGVILSPRESREAISLPPLSSDVLASSGRSAPRLDIDHPKLRPLTTGSSFSNLLSDVQSGIASAMRPMPPPFTLEPAPQWQPDPVLPIGPAWRGSNLLGQRRPGSMNHGRLLEPWGVERNDHNRNSRHVSTPDLRRSYRGGPPPFDPVRDRARD